MADRRLFNLAIKAMDGNPDQLAAIQEKGHCVLLAGPGSGKTRTLTTAMARALLDDVEEPRGIACITYNNECAIELESRLAKLGIEPTSQVFIGTVHSFALTQVIIPYARCVFKNFPKTLQIASKQQRDDAIISAYAKVINDQDNPFSRWSFAEEKRRKDLDRKSPDWYGKNPELARLIEAYEKELRRQNLIDFDDMSLIALRMVIGCEWIRESLKAKFPVLFIDEYQDLGTALHELVIQLCFKSGSRLFAVGDPDQSIYKFIGADPELFKALAERGDVKKITLPFNYRCGTNIIDASSAALGEERNYCAPDGAHKGDILFDAVNGDLEDQVNFIIKVLIPKLVSSGIPLEEIAVLYRDANDGNKLSDAANAASIPFIRADRNALVPRNNRLSRLIESAASWVTGGWKEGNPAFHRLTAEATSFVFSGTASTEEKFLIEDELVNFLHTTVDTRGSAHDWLLKFKTNLVTPWKKRARTLGDDWDIMDKMLSRTDSTPSNNDLSLNYFSGRMEQSGRLNLSTLHSAKGREFDIVILYGLNEDTFPSKRDKFKPEQLREVRRLFYVAVTRARKELHLVFKIKHYSPWVLEIYRRIVKQSKNIVQTHQRRDSL